MGKIFKLKAEEIKELIPRMGACLASDKITVEGMKVGYMYREEPNNNIDTAGNLLGHRRSGICR